MIEISKAIKLVKAQTPILEAEKIALADSVGRILAEPIAADTDLPPFDRSQMDGFALISSETENAPVSLRIAGESAAGRGWHKTLRLGEAVRIMTGAPVPAGADAVQKVELTSESANGSVTIEQAAKPGLSIVRRGAEIKKGEIVCRPGETVTEPMAAVLAAFGYVRVKAAKRPRVSIIGTGSEIVEIDKKPGRDQIRNSNSLMLDVLCRKFGCETRVLPIVKDDLDSLKSAI
jgi:molybdopterin molybdotransferase